MAIPWGPEGVRDPGVTDEEGDAVGVGGPAGEEALPVPAMVGEAGAGSVGGAAGDAGPGRLACLARRPWAAAGWCGAAAGAPPILLSGWALSPIPPAPVVGCGGPVPGTAPPPRAACARDVPAGPGAYRTTTGP
jgi:hypothetical protein